ncbi:TetR/AcrR family transcriptional regulator [Cryobacterium tepidiphilum]|uniref:TetR/AcrR family transcriptional regulator n=1 Tax=Cryobacterium tepidiphilum TaxID=2486026 RepID=A0A3M8LGC4_9MICO|nr:TetR family transcriptional regulator [Cryobacterium tepidiphilum]RNE63782.1 TetR/AcrR family transcriptional regulator [Cryobacterium tepidiphilum]
MSESRADAGGPEPGSGRRARGRPRGSAGETSADTRALILAAAAHEFGARGYEAASLRAIARRAGVDPALIRHYFDDKADLFATTIEAPFRPDRMVPVILAGPRSEVGEHLARYVLTELTSPAAQNRAALVLRTAVGHNAASRMLKEFLVREVLHRIALAIHTDDAELRASLAASQIVGLMLTRYVLKLEPIASAPVDDLVARLGPVLQWHLVDYAVGGAVAAPSPPATESLDSQGDPGE